jgi:hypothetical protein
MTKRTRAAQAAPSRSGTNITDARRAELGYGRLTLRLPLDALEMLAAEAERSEYSRAELVDSMIRMYLAPCRATETALMMAELAKKE